jgi:hypothetical protein
MVWWCMIRLERDFSLPEGCLDTLEAVPAVWKAGND